MENSKNILANHPVNKRRIEEGKSPATQIWLWGQGAAMQLDSYKDLYGLHGGVIATGDLLKGLAKLASLEAPNIEGANGLINTSTQVRLMLLLKYFEDFVYVHVEAPDECGHLGDAKLKVKAIELFDENIT